MYLRLLASTGLTSSAPQPGPPTLICDRGGCGVGWRRRRRMQVRVMVGGCSSGSHPSAGLRSWRQLFGLEAAETNAGEGDGRWMYQRQPQQLCATLCPSSFVTPSATVTDTVRPRAAMRAVAVAAPSCVVSKRVSVSVIDGPSQVPRSGSVGPRSKYAPPSGGW